MARNVLCCVPCAPVVDNNNNNNINADDDDPLNPMVAVNVFLITDCEHDSEWLF